MNLPNVSSIKLGAGIDTGRISAMAAPVGAIAVSVLILLVVVWPKFNSVLTLRSTNKELETRVLGLSAKVDVLSSLDKVELQQDLRYAELLLPSDKGTFSMIGQIEAAASGSGVNLSKVDVAPGSVSGDGSTSTTPAVAPAAGQSAKAPDAAPKIQVRVSVASDYNSLLTFLSTISSIARVTSIDDLVLSSSAVSGEPATLRTTMVINAFWKASPTRLGQIESEVKKLSDSEIATLAKAKNVVASGPSASVEVRKVPTGRSDLFAPF